MVGEESQGVDFQVAFKGKEQNLLGCYCDLQIKPLYVGNKSVLAAWLIRLHDGLSGSLFFGSNKICSLCTDITLCILIIL